MNKLELIDSLIEELKTLHQYREESKLDAVERRAEMVIRRVFGQDSRYIEDLRNIRFYPAFAPASEDYKVKCWHLGTEAMHNLFNTMKEELLLFETTAKEKQKQVDVEEQSNRVFVVHGHDDSMKLAVARTLEKLGLHPIILHEQPNLGRTIIEKFTDYSGVSFATVLLSPDDIGYPRNAPPEEAKYRARQNVILELGYFLGRLGRERVVVLHRQEERFEMPSDYSGVLYVPFDSTGRWQFDLVKELKACGYNVDANRLLD